MLRWWLKLAMPMMHLALDPSEAPRPSARVARVAELLDCDESDVRRLIRQGELETHHKGIRGVRIYLDSVRAYQDRNTKPASKPIHRKSRAPGPTAAYRSAMASLKAKGII